MKLSKNVLIFLLISILVCASAFAVLDDADFYYSFDDADLTGSNPDDLSGNGNDGTNNGATTGVTGKLNQAFSYDGSNDYVDTDVAYNGETELSFSHWIYIDTMPGTSRYVWGSSGGGSFDFFSNIMADDTYRFIVRTSQSQIELFTSTLSEDTWHHVAGTWKSGGDIKIYLDGTLDDSDTAQTDTNSYLDLFIGGLNAQGSVYNPVNAEIDEFTVYTRELSSTEVSNVWNEGLGFNPYAASGPSQNVTAIYEQSTDVDLKNPITISDEVLFTNVITQSVELKNSSSVYQTYSFETYSDIISSLNCQVIVDDLNVYSENSLISVPAGSVKTSYMVTELFNLTDGVHEIELECKTNLASANITISSLKGIYHEMKDRISQLDIKSRYYNESLNITSSSYTKFADFNFTTTDRYSSGEYIKSVLLDFDLQLDFDTDDSTISFIVELDGQNSTEYKRTGDEDEFGRGGGANIKVNVTQGNTSSYIPIRLFAKSTSSDGSIKTNMVAKEFITSILEIDEKHFSEVIDRNLGTTTKLQTIELDNTHTTTASLIVKAGIVGNSLGGSHEIEYFFAIEGGEVGSTLNRTYSSAGIYGLTVLQDSFNITNERINVSLYANYSSASVSSEINITGDMTGYVSDKQNLTFNGIELTAKNDYDGSSISSFSVSFDNGNKLITDNGVIFLDLDVSKVNLTFNATEDTLIGGKPFTINYVGNIYEDHSTSLNLTGRMNQSITDITPRLILSGNTISTKSWNVSNSYLQINNGGSSKITIGPNQGLFRYNLTSPDFYDKLDLNSSLNIRNSLEPIVYDTILNITMYNITGSNYVQTFNVTLNVLGNTTTYFTTSGSILVLAEQGLTYSLNSSRNGVYPTSESFSDVSSLTYNKTINVVETGSIAIEVRDVNNFLITQKVDLQITTEIQSNISFTGGTQIIRGADEGDLYQLDFSSSGYDDKQYILTFSETLTQPFVAIMEQGGSEFLFTTLDSSGDVLKEVKISTYSYVNTSLTLSGSVLTDGVGQALLNLNPNSTYRFVIEKEGYITQDIFLSLSQTSYVFNLQAISTVDYSGPVSGVFWDYDPRDTNLISNLSQDFNWSVVTESGVSLTAFGIEAYVNGTKIGETVSTSSTGGDITLNLNTDSYINRSIDIVYFFEKNGKERYELPIRYNIIEEDIDANLYALRRYAKANLSSTDKVITLYLILMIMSAMLIGINLNVDKLLGLIIFIAGFFGWALGFSTPTELGILFLTLSTLTFGLMGNLKTGGEL